MDEFYLQDKRTYVGNDMVFWREGGSGYTTNVNEAGVFSRERAFAQNRCRETDIPWPKEYIDNKVRPTVDFQCVNIKEALGGVDGILAEMPKKMEAKTYPCLHCGKFISLQHVREHGWTCPHCAGSNWP